LGRPELRLDGEPLPQVTPPRALALLAFLIVNQGRRLTRAAVASALWPDELEEDARANLRRHLHRLNAVLPKIDGVAWIATTSVTVEWNPDAPAWIDVHEFVRLAAADESSARAAELYGGDFLDGTFDDWVLAERERLLSSFLELAYERAVRARAARDFVQARDYADRMLALGEWREDALRLKIAALYEMGDRPGALAAFDAFAKELRDEMGVDVMPETRALRDAVLANVPLSAEPSASRPAQPAVPIVGRSAELERLLAVWHIAARRTGTTVFVGGEAGVGKTRLLAEFAQHVELQGGHALFGHAREGEGAPYQPLVDVVRAAAPYLLRDELPDVWLAALAPLVPELLRLHPDLPEIPNIEGGKQRLHEAFARVLESLARRRPVAVILEDLHWANVDTLDALEHLARRAGSSHIALVATYRPEEASSTHPLRELRRHLQNEHRATVLSLGPLDGDGIRALVAEAAPDAPDAAALSDAVFRLSEGNPLFAWQLVQSYLETGTISTDSVAIDRAIAARAARLDPQTRRVLDIASLVGDRFTVEELAEIGGWDESAVFAAVDDLLDLRLFRYAAPPGLDLAFAHRLIRDAIAADVAPQGRAGLHRRIATVLERTRDADAGLVASHYALAGNREAAYRTYLCAARTALAIFANADALERAEHAHRLAGDDRERYDALLVVLDAVKTGSALGRWESAVGELEAAAASLGVEERFEALRRRCRLLDLSAKRAEHAAAARRLHELAHETGRPEHRMHALHELGRYELLQGRLQEGTRLLEEALDAAPPDEPAATVRILSILTFGLLRAGDLERGTQALERAREIVRTEADLELASDLLTADLAVALVLEDEETYRRVGEHYLELLSKVGSLSGTGMASAALGQAALMRGDIAEARRRYGDAIAIFERHNIRQNFLSDHINVGVFERELGNFDAAFAHWAIALPLAERMGAKSSIACCAINVGEALLACGDLEAALPKLEEALALCRDLGEPRLTCDALAALGFARVRAGDVEPGLALVREAIETRRQIKAARTLPNDYCFLIEALLEARRPAEAAAAAAELLALYEAAPDRQMFPTRILAALAGAARAAGNEGDARRFAAMGQRLFDARMAQLPDDATRASFAAMSFNRVYGVGSAV
jgi:DNA-binding SARP family transcriptional activator